MNRRHFLMSCLGLAAMPVIVSKSFGGQDASSTNKIEKIDKSDAEWQRLLTPDQYEILRREGTEASFSSELNKSL